jgi:hypothetical protein
MLFQSLRALSLALGGPGSIWNHLGAPVRSTGVSGRFACGFRTDLHFADEPEDGLSGHSQEASGCSLYLRCGDSIDVSYPHVGMDITLLSDSPNWVRQGWYLVVRQSQLGEARMVFGCQTVLIGCDKYVIHSVSLFIQHCGSRGGYTVNAGD